MEIDHRNATPESMVFSNPTGRVRLVAKLTSRNNGLVHGHAYVIAPLQGDAETNFLGEVIEQDECIAHMRLVVSD